MHMAIIYIQISDLSFPVIIIYLLVSQVDPLVLVYYFTDILNHFIFQYSLSLEMLSEPKGKQLGTLRCRGLKPPVVKGHAAAFKYWFNAFGHTGPYSQTVQEVRGVQKIIPKGNPMESPGKFVVVVVH